ncbi:MAG: hypothetical protein ACOX3A_05855, partial [bacterium]
EIDFEYVFLSEYNLKFCQGCYQCFDQGEEFCPLKDDRDVLLEKIEYSDGVGRKQWISLRGWDKNAPVLLFLAGCPGGTTGCPNHPQQPLIQAEKTSGGLPLGNEIMGGTTGTVALKSVGDINRLFTVYTYLLAKNYVAGKSANGYKKWEKC